MPLPFRTFIKRQDGVSTVEFVTIFLVLLGFIFLVVEFTLYLFYAASVEKAAQAGVRAAVVSDPVAAGVPLTIGRTSSGVYGISCSDASAPCVPFATQTCTGTGCTAGNFNRIFNHMQGFSGQLAPENVTITYEDVGLGFAGGPTVPLVTIAIEDVPFQTGIIGLILSDVSQLVTLPTRSASMTGEDLN